MTRTHRATVAREDRLDGVAEGGGFGGGRDRECEDEKKCVEAAHVVTTTCEVLALWLGRKFRETRRFEESLSSDRYRCFLEALA